VKGDSPVVGSYDPNNVAAPDFVTFSDGSAAEIRVRGPQATVVDRDGPVSDDHSTE